MAAGAPSQEAEVEAVITAVKQELQRASPVAPHLRLTKIDLELSLAVKRGGSAGLTFKIPLLGTISVGATASAGRSDTSKLELSFEAPKPTIRVQDVELGGLAGALQTLERSITLGRNSPPQLDFKGGDVTFVFGMTLGVKGELQVVVIDTTAEYSREETHAVKLHFDPVP